MQDALRVETLSRFGAMKRQDRGGVDKRQQRSANRRSTLGPRLRRRGDAVKLGFSGAITVSIQWVGEPPRKKPTPVAGFGRASLVHLSYGKGI